MHWLQLPRPPLGLHPWDLGRPRPPFMTKRLPAKGNPTTTAGAEEGQDTSGSLWSTLTFPIITINSSPSPPPLSRFSPLWLSPITHEA